MPARRRETLGEARIARSGTTVRFNPCSLPQGADASHRAPEPAAPSWFDDPELEALEQDLRTAGEAGPVARGLIRHLERPTELVTAAVPEGRGDEVSSGSR